MLLCFFPAPAKILAIRECYMLISGLAGSIRRGALRHMCSCSGSASWSCAPARGFNASTSVSVGVFAGPPPCGGGHSAGAQLMEHRPALV